MVIPNILICDDEVDFLNTLSEYIEDRIKCNVVRKTDAYETIDVLKKERVDVLFQDIYLLGGSGFRAMEYIRDNKLKTFIFCITKCDDREYTDIITSFGAKFIPKNPTISLPVLLDTLKSKLDEIGGFDYKK